MKADLKDIIRNEYVHGYINALGQRVMPTLEDLINKYEAPAYMNQLSYDIQLNFSQNSLVFKPTLDPRP